MISQKTYLWFHGFYFLIVLVNLVIFSWVKRGRLKKLYIEQKIVYNKFILIFVNKFEKNVGFLSGYVSFFEPLFYNSNYVRDESIYKLTYEVYCYYVSNYCLNLCIVVLLLITTYYSILIITNQTVPYILRKKYCIGRYMIFIMIITF